MASSIEEWEDRNEDERFIGSLPRTNEKSEAGRETCFA
jgi:hypothetical protein